MLLFGNDRLTDRPVTLLKPSMWRSQRANRVLTSLRLEVGFSLQTFGDSRAD